MGLALKMEELSPEDTKRAMQDTAKDEEAIANATAPGDVQPQASTESPISEGGSRGWMTVAGINSSH